MASQQPVQPASSQPPVDSPPTGSGEQRQGSRQWVKTPRSRAGAAWVGICIAALVLTALVVFMLQNTQPVSIRFLSMRGSVPLALALLIAGIGVGVVALVIGTVRISQLRRRLTHERQA